jgi:hypothetical protein
MSKFGTVTRGGHTAQFKVEGKLLTVTSPLGTKTTQLGALEAEFLAGQLLGELIADANRKN